MKKLQVLICLISISISSNILYSQDFKGEKIKYTFAENDLKEFLSIQALLSENRMDELIEFMDENSYVYSDEDNIGIRFIKNRAILNEIIPMVYIQSGKNDDIFVDNSLLVFFGVTRKIDPLDVYWSVSDLNSEIIVDLFKSKIEIGYMYNIFKDIKSNETLTVENIDRYTKKLIPISDPENTKIIKASNFYTFEQWPNQISFAGPGKTLGTIIEFHNNKTNNGTDRNIMTYVSIKSLKLEDPASENSFNLQFFFNLKNLNDRIWWDK